MSDTVDTLRDAVAIASTILRNGTKKSVTEYVRASMVEPTVLLDSRIALSDNSAPIMRNVLNVMASYYVHAVTMMGSVGDLRIESVLDSINPDRDPLIAGGGKMGSIGISFESDDDVAYGVSQKDVSAINEHSALSVGSNYSVEINHAGQKANIPFSVRLRTVVGTPTNIVGALSVGKNKSDLSDIYYQLKSGQKSFFRDIILGQADVEEHRKNLKEDNTGMYKSSLKRNRKNKLSALLSMRPSVSTASSIIVISDDTANELRSSIRGKVSDFKTREKLFENTFTTMLVVVNEDDRVITYYTRGHEMSFDVSIKEVLRTKANSAGMDMLELVNQLNTGGMA